MQQTAQSWYADSWGTMLDVKRDQRVCFDAARCAAGSFPRAGAVGITVAGKE